MKIQHLALPTLYVLLLMPLVVYVIPKCNAQTSGLTITHEEYGWTDEMKEAGMTTPQIGLTFKIIIYNNSTEPLDFGNPNLLNTLYIVISVRNDENPQSSYFFKQLTFDYNNELYLPPNQSDIRYVKVDHYGNLAIGSYTATLAYSIGNAPYANDGTPIEPYPFNFRVASNDQLQQTIQQIQKNKSGGPFLVIGPFSFTIIEVSGGGISIVIISAALGLYLRNRKKK